MFVELVGKFNDLLVCIEFLSPFFRYPLFSIKRSGDLPIDRASGIGVITQVDGFQAPFPETRGSIKSPCNSGILPA